MKRIYLFLVLFALSMSVSAQKYFYEKEREEYKQATPEVKVKMDSSFVGRENYYRKQQVKSVCGIDFGATLGTARRISQKKFGISDDYSFKERKELSYTGVQYAGHFFSNLYLMFQSKGTKSYFNYCIFVNHVGTLDEAKRLVKVYAKDYLKKYNLHPVNGEGENPKYMGGVSPLWNGRWYKLTIEDLAAVCVDIIEYSASVAEETGYPYAVRISYGPFNYVKEEF